MKNKLIIFVSSIVFILLVDLIVGDKILSILLKNDREYFETKYRIKHEIYNHTLRNNFKGIGWWDKKYQICTNYLGAKAECNNSRFLKNEEYDLIILGDSNTEGVGLTWNQTYVGKISENLKNKKILNLAVAGYSFSHYLSKANYFLNKIKFKEVIIFIDPSDVYDEKDLFFKNNKNKFVVHNSLEKYTFFKKLLKPFPMSYRFLVGVRRIIGKLKYKQNIKLKNYLSESFHITHWLNEENKYSEINKTSYDRLIKKSLKNMETLYEILNAKNISLSIVVYPHPVQIYNNNLYSRNEKIWENFCIQRCKKFYNLSKSFKYNTIPSIEIIKKYYIDGDIHFNEKGAELISKLFLKEFN